MLLLPAPSSDSVQVVQLPSWLLPVGCLCSLVSARTVPLDSLLNRLLRPLPAPLNNEYYSLGYTTAAAIASQMDLVFSGGLLF